MEYYTIYSAPQASYTALVAVVLITLAAGVVLYVAAVAVVIRELLMWGRDMDKRAARLEREHQEYMVSSELDARRSRIEHAKRMRRLNTRRW